MTFLWIDSMKSFWPIIVLDFEIFGLEEFCVGNIERDLFTFLIIDTESPVFSFNSSTHFLGRHRLVYDKIVIIDT